MKQLEEYLSEGYEIYNHIEKSKIKSIKSIDLDEQMSQRLLDCDPNYRYELFKPESEDEIVVYKSAYYHITIRDLLRSLERLKEEDTPYACEEWLKCLSFKYHHRYVYSPLVAAGRINLKKYKNDYLFKDRDHIVMFVVQTIINHLQDEEKPDYDKLTKFVVGTTNNDGNQEYEDDVLSIMVQNACAIIMEDQENTSSQIIDFYRSNLIKLAKKEDYMSMRLLGYEHYEGTNGFEVDPYKAEYYLKKCFDISHDPDLARTLGYIYYYGRTNNGVPDGDKAFQYFAIGHIAGGYIEATYKLADCYVKGYGTPVCYQAAYQLVDGIIEDQRNRFLNGDDSKFADVALRLASYYKDGIYVDKNLFGAQIYYLEARCAIKKRLEHMEYIGDRSVAVNIHKTLDELNKEVGCKERIVVENGYLLEDFSMEIDGDFKAELIGNGYIKITLKPEKKSKIKYLMSVITDINFSERTDKIEYLIKNEFASEGLIESINSHKVLSVCFDKHEVYFNFENKDLEDFPAYSVADEIIIVPQTLKDFTKKYTVVSVEFYPGSKTYDYLSLKDNVSVGDKVSVTSKGELKAVTIKSIKKLFEDELPLPLEKMAKIK